MFKGLLSLLLISIISSSQLYEVKKNLHSFFRWGSQVYHFDLDYLPSFDQEFKQTPSYVKRDGEIIPIHDKKIRNTYDGFVSQPLFDQKTVPLLRQYMQSIGQEDEIVVEQLQKWNILKYDQGHFLQHCDRDRSLNTSLHNIATQIIIPPRRINNFQKGQLLIFQTGQYVEVVPHDTLWTYIVLPLGIPHQVKQVKGLRISYRRPVQIIKKHGLQQEYEKFKNTCVIIKNIGNKKKTKQEIKNQDTATQDKQL